MALLFPQGFPTANTPLVQTETGNVTPTWLFFFLTLFNRTGGGGGSNATLFNFPETTGNPGQILTSQGPGLATTWLSPPTKLSAFTNDVGFITTSNLGGLAPLNSPQFTGIPKAPTPILGDNSTQIATTAFVAQNVITLNSPTFTGTPAGPTPLINTNTTQLATTAFVIGQESNALPLIDGNAASGVSTTVSRSDHIHPLSVTATASNPGSISYPGGLIVKFGSTVFTLTAGTGGTFGSIVFATPFPTSCFTCIVCNGDDTFPNGPVHCYGAAVSSGQNIIIPSGTATQLYRVNWTAYGH